MSVAVPGWQLPESWEREPGAARAPLGRYRRREPERTLLHQVVREELESFLSAARERSVDGRGLPAFVERELRAYLGCGLLGRGFARVRCPDCSWPSPARPTSGSASAGPAAAPAATRTPNAATLPSLRTCRVPWAELLKRVFDVDVLACPECGGRLRIIAFIAAPTVATKILDHLGLASTGPPTAPARRPLELLDPASDYAHADLTYDS